MNSAWQKAKRVSRTLLSALPGGQRVLRAYRYYRKKQELAHVPEGRNIFEYYYLNNSWGCTESVSGPGSTLQFTENIRKEIPRLAMELGLGTIFDAPCGDYNWFRAIHWAQPIKYIGGDIVGPLIAQNQSRYAGIGVHFIQINIVSDLLPSADLWLCRDCLFHLSYRDIFLVLRNFLKSDIRYLLTTTHSACEENVDIPTGAFRLLNLRKEPFGLGAPSALIDDWVEGYPVAHLALWDRHQLRSSLIENPIFRRLEASPY